ncbi:MAG TPA: DNA polymerase III subunit epsilon [Rhizomicrobium sp.]|jgi:DNA polymerase-3 subunit epsilon|nr:DNA polymerase III subunit epsilon [Rhizomicrobium sp.]
MREIVLDTETTGLDPNDGHRIVEIGCVELIDHLPTGNNFQRYLNPERLVGESERIHGIADAFLADKPRFGEVALEFIAFIGDAPLVIHNAGFDLKFLNHELARASHPPIPFARAIDTIEIAKAKIPGVRYSLDELCKRFSIDLSGRVKHGALLDAELTARLYLELVGGRQTRLMLGPGDSQAAIAVVEAAVARTRPNALASRLSPAEQDAHVAFIAGELGKDPIWNWN